MSASLVGSEMCIRDSRCSTRGRQRLCNAATPLLPSMCAVARPVLRCVGSVSYTHLTLPTICSV
eukprot:2918577-Alexandrium_andersonii.AAC.1